MKIKEVITKTDLTDRAIRLYIENGLVSPSISENYSGRKNIEFSDDDLATLKNIATLRKAEFSIAEIKSITEGSQNCKSVLEEFIRNKTDKIENDTKIVEALSPLLGEEEADISIICEKLNSVILDNDVPAEDTRTPIIEKIERIFFLSVAAVSVIYTIVYAAVNIYLYTGEYSFKYPHGYDFLCLMPIALLLLSLYYYLRYRKKLQKKSKRKIFTRQLTSLLLVVPLGFLMFFMFVTTLLSVGFEPLIYSQTTDVSDYLILDENIKIPEDFFPEEVPEFAKPEKYVKWLPFEKDSITKYFYQYQIGEGGGAVDVFAEWSDHNFLTKEENIEKVIKEMASKKALDGSSPTVMQKGDWTLYYYADTSETDLHFGYTYLIFAHNNYRNTIRYIYSTNNIKPVANMVTPYYLTLEWY